jgi:hypothetical protein
MSERRPEPAEPEPSFHYPPLVRSAAERRRWDLAQAIAEALFEDEAGTDPAAIWMATRSVYRSSIETGE